MLPNDQQRQTSILGKGTQLDRDLTQNRQIDQSKLYIISGPSGAGKGTVIRRLLEIRSDLKVAISATTRPPREGEIHGVHYYFTSPDAFKDDIQRNQFIEFCEVHGNQYGTLKREIIRLQKDGGQVILEIDVQGAKKILEIFTQVKTIFIAPPSLDELRLRLISRGTDSDESIQKRLRNAIEELKEQTLYNCCVTNISIENTTETINRFISNR